MLIEHTAKIVRKIDLDKDKNSLAITIDDKTRELLKKFTVDVTTDSTYSNQRYRIKSILRNNLSSNIDVFFDEMLLTTGTTNILSENSFPNDLDRVFKALIGEIYRLLRVDISDITVEVKKNDDNPEVTN